MQDERLIGYKPHLEYTDEYTSDASEIFNSQNEEDNNNLEVDNDIISDLIDQMEIIDSLIDLPFALPTAVAGITLTTLYSQDGWIGKYLSLFGIKVSFTLLGIVVALSFISIPFVVRTVQPVIENLDSEVEEAAKSLGANSFITFIKVIFPEIIPSLLTGFSLAFARAVGEYGSVVFISGNMPLKTEIAPLIIMTKMEQYDYEGATVIAGGMLIISFITLLIINLIQWYTASYHKAK